VRAVVFALLLALPVALSFGTRLWAQESPAPNGKLDVGGPVAPPLDAGVPSERDAEPPPPPLPPPPVPPPIPLQE
jgi:hypothetical protein